jgi:hypothetical protein
MHRCPLSGRQQLSENLVELDRNCLIRSFQLRAVAGGPPLVDHDPLRLSLGVLVAHRRLPCETIAATWDNRGVPAGVASFWRRLDEWSLQPKLERVDERMEGRDGGLEG